MKTITLLVTFIVSLSVFGSESGPDFYCESVKPLKKMDVRFEDGVLSYDNGRSIEVAVASTTNDGKILKVSGLSKGLVFAGGGRQSVSMKLDLKAKKASISIYTKTFYRNEDESHDLTCTL